MKTLKEKSQLISNTIFLILFGSIVAGIINRYAFGSKIQGINEITFIAFVWVVMFAGSVNVKFHDQISFDLLRNSFSEKISGILFRVERVIILAVFTIGIYFFVDYAFFVSSQVTPILKISFFYVYIAFPAFVFFMMWQLIYPSER